MRSAVYNNDAMDKHNGNNEDLWLRLVGLKWQYGCGVLRYGGVHYSAAHYWFDAAAAAADASSEQDRKEW